MFKFVLKTARTNLKL